MDFSSRLAGLDTAIADHLCDDAAYLLQGAGAPVSARVQVDRPIEVERLQGSSFVRARPVLQVAVAAFPGLRTGDVFVMGAWSADGLTFTPSAEAWRLAEAPRRPGDGRWWQVEVETWVMP